MRKTGFASLIVVLACGGLAPMSTQGANWPQWRGPELTGVAPGANPPSAWSETKNIQWKYDIPGIGGSTPIIWGDKVFIQTAVDTQVAGTPPDVGQGGGGGARPGGARPGGQGGPGGRRPRGRGGRGGGGGGGAPTTVHNFDIICLDRNSGDVLWQATAQSEVPHEGHRSDHSFASHSPVTDGEHIYVWFGSRGLHCFTLDGKKVWSRDLMKMRTRNAFGEASSPAIHGDTIVVNCDQEGQSEIFAIDKKTGKTIWSQKRDESTTWVTPLILEVGGKAQVIVSATRKTRAYDLASGDIVWECGGQTTNVIPTPVAGFGKVYATSGYQGNSLQAIELGHTGDLTGSDAVKMLATRDTPYVPSPLLYGENLYILSKNDGVISSYNAQTGAAMMPRTRLPGMTGVYASPVGAAGRVYLPGRYGKVIVFKDGASLEVVATNELDDEFNASPAIVDDQVFLRGKNSLYCISER